MDSYCQIETDITCNSFDSSYGYGFLNMTYLSLWYCKSIIELDLLMKPDYFPALITIDLIGTNIITIPKSISRFPRLGSLLLYNCKYLREVQGLPQSIRWVNACDCPLLDNESGLSLSLSYRETLSLNALRDLVNEKC